MKIDKRDLLAATAPGALLALVLLAAAGLVTATLDAPERTAFWALLAPRMALVFLLWLVLAIGAGTLARRLWQRHGAAPGRLAEDLQVLLSSDTASALKSEGSAGAQALAAAVNALAAQRDTLRTDIAAQVAAASRQVEQERNRLAALMAELTQSVVVCNLDGRVLLFNARARLQFRALARGDPGAADGTPDGRAIGGAEALGLGRSIYGVLDRRLVTHALEAVQERLQRGAAHPSAQFVTATHGGQLLRVHLAPVRASPGAAAPGHAPVHASVLAPLHAPVLAPEARADEPLNGFVLMLDNITRDLAEDTERDRLLHGLTEGYRGSLGTLQAAVELLDDPDLDPPTRERFRAVVREEITTMGRRLNDAAAQGLRRIKTRWPLEDMLGADLVAAAARRIEAQRGARVLAQDVDARLWLRVDSYSLVQALLHLAGRLADDYGVQRLQLRLAAHEGKAQLDLVWAVQAMSTETVTAWETEPIKAGDDATPLTVRDVVERHGGAFWFERERVRHESFFRFLLPLASEGEQLDAGVLLHGDSRPEYYDFDLFATHAGADGALVDRTLADLSYTVFDTETTGLSPREGDEIIQIGATRIVAGKLRRQECFEQLVDPRRSLPAAGVAIHGITAQMLRGQPTLDSVLPAFHAFARDSVLVAHNAAFDMRFLQLKEAATGVRFEQPVLDTLLLSAVIHPQQESHRLEAIAQRLGVSVLGRHTALGDALVTAEVFVRMLPLLQAMGIHTLAQALEASRKTYLARVSY